MGAVETSLAGRSEPPLARTPHLAFPCPHLQGLGSQLGFSQFQTQVVFEEQGLAPVQLSERPRLGDVDNQNNPPGISYFLR